MPAMNKPMREVMRRRGELLARIAAQREQIAAIGAHYRAPLALADKGWSAVRFLRSNFVLVAGVAALIVIQRRGVTGLAKLGWKIWGVYKSVRSFVEKNAPHLRH